MRLIPRTAALLAIAASALAVAPDVSQAQNSVCGAGVVVGFGETLSAIARRCGTTVPDLMAANPRLLNPYFILPGMQIRMPERALPPSPVAGALSRYIVRPGDTLSSIARGNNLTLTEIFRLNPDIDAGSMRVGDVVLLPGRIVTRPEPPRPPVGNVLRYTVRPGDTLSSIARMHGVTLADIYRFNPNIDSRTLRVGDVVQLRGGVVPPPASPTDVNVIRYTIRPGDTLFSIAQANGTTRSEIIRLNPGLDPTRLRVGDVIRLQGGIAPPSPAPAQQQVSLSPTSGTPGSIAQLSVSGFRPSTPLRALVGRSALSLREFQQLTTDQQGRATLSVRIPSWAAEDTGTLIFAVETLDGRFTARSNTFRVTSATPAPAGNRIAVTGTLTREGAECPAMRGDDGQLYTLSRGSTEGFSPGDRVRVQGQLAEVSFCQQGTTINVVRIDSAP
jgi:LysM repeat protein